MTTVIIRTINRVSRATSITFSPPHPSILLSHTICGSAFDNCISQTIFMFSAYRETAKLREHASETVSIYD